MRSGLAYSELFELAIKSAHIDLKELVIDGEDVGFRMKIRSSFNEAEVVSYGKLFGPEVERSGISGKEAAYLLLGKLLVGWGSVKFPEDQVQKPGLTLPEERFRSREGPLLEVDWNCSHDAKTLAYNVAAHNLHVHSAVIPRILGTLDAVFLQEADFRRARPGEAVVLIPYAVKLYDVELTEEGDGFDTTAQGRYPTRTRTSLLEIETIGPPTNRLATMFQQKKIPALSRSLLTSSLSTGQMAPGEAEEEVPALTPGGKLSFFEAFRRRASTSFSFSAGGVESPNGRSPSAFSAA